MTPDRAAELISMLCAKTQKYEPAIATFGALQRYDLVHALALVKSLPAQMLVRIKYTGDVSHGASFIDELVSAIERGMLGHTAEFASPQKWKVPRKDFLRDMCRLALVECLSPHLCWYCEGHAGSLDVEGRYHVCEECGGSGVKRPTERKRARMLGVEESAWKHSWSERYKLIQGVIDRFEEIGLGGAAKRLSA